MTLIPEQQLERERRDLLVSELELAGAKLKGNVVTCPWHEDTHPSAGIFTDQGVWRFRCHGCGVSGDVFDIRARNQNRSLGDVLADCQPQPQVQERVYLLEELQRFDGFESLYLYSNPDTHVAEFVVVRLRKGDGKSFLQGRPEGDGVVLKAPKGLLPIYNRARVRDAEEIVIVEGEKCVHALHDVGIVATTSPGGAGKAAMADWSLVTGKRVYLWPDNDPKGQDHMRDVTRILEANNTLYQIDVEALNLAPKGDVADYLKTNGGTPEDGNTAIRLVLDEASSVDASRELEQRLEDMVSGKWKSVDWPWARTSCLAKALLPGTITVLPGDPGSAKSFLLLESMWFWHLAGIKAAVYELEEDRTYHLQRALAQLEKNANLTDPEWVHNHPKETAEAFSRQREILDSFGKIIWDAPDGEISLDQLGDWVEERAKAGCEIIGVDPVTAAQASDKPWLDDQRFILRTKRIMRQYRSRLILVTHPRISRGKEVGLNKMAGGAAYERFSQCVLWLRRHDHFKRSEVLSDEGRLRVNFERTLKICKARNGAGAGREIAFTLNPITLRFEERGLIVEEEEGSYFQAEEYK